MLLAARIACLSKLTAVRSPTGHLRATYGPLTGLLRASYGSLTGLLQASSGPLTGHLRAIYGPLTGPLTNLFTATYGPLTDHLWHVSGHRRAVRALPVPSHRSFEPSAARFRRVMRALQVQKPK